MEFETPELEHRYAHVVEGQCPNGHGSLERRDDYGYCGECGIGWSIRGREVTVHFGIEGGSLHTDSGTFDLGPGDVRFKIETTGRYEFRFGPP
jgi:hypothetical protein